MTVNARAFHASRASRAFVTLGLLAAVLTGPGMPAAHADAAGGPSWGAIAAVSSSYGYSLNQRSRAAAEQAARDQCNRVAGRAGGCNVMAFFDRSCGALAIGNDGEWGSATAATAPAAGQAAEGQCESHLPTEPCKVLVSVCSAR